MTLQRQAMAFMGWAVLATFPGQYCKGQNTGPSNLPKRILAAHNSMRFLMGIRGLVWSDRLARKAQDWANTLLTRGQFRHRANSEYGENLFEIRVPWRHQKRW